MVRSFALSLLDASQREKWTICLVSSYFRASSDCDDRTARLAGHLVKSRRRPNVVSYYLTTEGRALVESVPRGRQVTFLSASYLAMG